MGGNSQFDSSTRQIVLTPSLNNTPPNPSTPTSTSVAIRNNQKSGGNHLPFSSTPQPSAQFQMPVAVIVDQASDASGNQISQRLSVSEPFQPYPTPNALSPTYPDGTQIAYQTPYDDPLDGFVPTVGSQNARQPLPASSSYWNVVLTTGTTLQFRYVHLQRLANPMLPWDSTRNPYRTGGLDGHRPDDLQRCLYCHGRRRQRGRVTCQYRDSSDGRRTSSSFFRGSAERTISSPGSPTRLPTTLGHRRISVVRPVATSARPTQRYPRYLSRLLSTTRWGISTGSSTRTRTETRSQPALARAAVLAEPCTWGPRSRGHSHGLRGTTGRSWTRWNCFSSPRSTPGNCS